MTIERWKKKMEMSSIEVAGMVLRQTKEEPYSWLGVLLATEEDVETSSRIASALDSFKENDIKLQKKPYEIFALIGVKLLTGVDVLDLVDSEGEEDGDKCSVISTPGKIEGGSYLEVMKIALAEYKQFLKSIPVGVRTNYKYKLINTNVNSWVIYNIDRLDEMFSSVKTPGLDILDSSLEVFEFEWLKLIPKLSNHIEFFDILALYALMRLFEGDIVALHDLNKRVVPGEYSYKLSACRTIDTQFIRNIQTAMNSNSIIKIRKMKISELLPQPNTQNFVDTNKIIKMLTKAIFDKFGELKKEIPKPVQQLAAPVVQYDKELSQINSKIDKLGLRISGIENSLSKIIALMEKSAETASKPKSNMSLESLLQQCTQSQG